MKLKLLPLLLLTGLLCPAVSVFAQKGSKQDSSKADPIKTEKEYNNATKNLSDTEYVKFLTTHQVPKRIPEKDQKTFNDVRQKIKNDVTTKLLEIIQRADADALTTIEGSSKSFEKNHLFTAESKQKFLAAIEARRKELNPETVVEVGEEVIPDEAPVETVKETALTKEETRSAWYSLWSFVFGGASAKAATNEETAVETSEANKQAEKIKEQFETLSETQKTAVLLTSSKILEKGEKSNQSQQDVQVELQKFLSNIQQETKAVQSSVQTNEVGQTPSTLTQVEQPAVLEQQPTVVVQTAETSWWRRLFGLGANASTAPSSSQNN